MHITAGKKIKNIISGCVLLGFIFLFSTAFSINVKNVVMDPEKYPVYETAAVDTLISGKTEALKGMYVMVPGKVLSVDKKGSEITIAAPEGNTDKGLTCKCASKELKDQALTYAAGDRIRVYGKAAETGVFNRSMEVKAYAIEYDTGMQPSAGTYIQAGGKIIGKDSMLMRSLAGGRVTFSIPQEWSGGIEHELLPEELGSMEGYQYRLNEIRGSSSIQPESLFIAYFGKELLESDNDIHETFPIERAIASNILKKDISWNTSFPMLSKRTYYGQWYDYFQSSYKVGVEGYRTEFIFIPDGDSGMVVILYVYRGGSEGHLGDIMTVLRFLEIDD